MDDDAPRCPTCDGRYCGYGPCRGATGDVWVNGKGWTSPTEATALESRGRVVQWDSVWTPEKYGLTR